MDKSLELCTVFGFIFLITGCSLFFPNESGIQGQNGYSDDDSRYQNATTSYPSSCYIGGTSLSNNTAHNGYGNQHKIPANDKFRLVLPSTTQRSKHQLETQTNHKQVEGQSQASPLQIIGDGAKPIAAQTQANTRQTNRDVTMPIAGQTQANTRQNNEDAVKLNFEAKQQEFLRNQQQMQNNYLQQQRQNEFSSEVAHKVQETNYQIESNIRKAEYEFAKKQQEEKKRAEEEQQAIQNQVHQMQMQQAIQNSGFHFPGR